MQFKAYYVVIVCSFMFLTSNAIAQISKPNADSKKMKDLEQFVSTSSAIDEIEELIYDVFDTKKDTLTGLQLCKIYLERGKKEKNDAIQYFSSFQIAYINYVKANYHKTVKYAHSCVKIANKTNDTINSISSNTLLGSTLYVLGNYDDALKYYISAKELSAQRENSPYEILCLTNIANISTKLNRFEDALKSYHQILTILDKKEDTSFVQYLATYLSSLLGKGLCLSELESFEEAEEIYQKGISLAEANNLQEYKGYFYINLGNLYYKKKEYHTSFGFLKQGKDLLVDQGLKNNLFIADFYIARNYFEEKKYEDAIALLDGIFKSTGTNSNTDRITEMYELAIAISKVQGNKEKQIYYLDKLNEIIKVKNEKKSLAKDLLFEDALKDMTSENEKLNSEKHKSLIDKRIILVVSIALLIVVLIGFVSYHKKTKLKEQKFLAIIDDISKKKTKKKSKDVAKVSKIKDEKANAILEQLETLENTQFYLSPEVTLHTTAKLLNTNTSYLSKALNAVKKQTFSQYLNKLRIDYVLVKLKEDAVFRSYTIHAISKEIGYKSATTFIKEFKNKTGLNPSYYIKKIEG